MHFSGCFRHESTEKDKVNCAQGRAILKYSLRGAMSGLSYPSS